MVRGALGSRHGMTLFSLETVRLPEMRRGSPAARAERATPSSPPRPGTRARLLNYTDATIRKSLPSPRPAAAVRAGQPRPARRLAHRYQRAQRRRQIEPAVADSRRTRAGFRPLRTSARL